jgi:hypothetical protein
MRDKYKERVRIEKMRMLNEILSANEPKAKRAVVARFNPYFYLLFQDGVKRYEQNTKDIGSQTPNDQTAEVAIRPDTGGDGVEDTQERSH